MDTPRRCVSRFSTRGELRRRRPSDAMATLHSMRPARRLRHQLQGLGAAPGRRPSTTAAAAAAADSETLSWMREQLDAAVAGESALRAAPAHSGSRLTEAELESFTI